MTEQAERYDRIADGYARWWGPIIAPAAVGVLDEIDDAVAAGATRAARHRHGNRDAGRRGDPPLAERPGDGDRRLLGDDRQGRRRRRDGAHARPSGSA